MQCVKCQVELTDETRCCEAGVCCKMCCKCENGEVDPECGCDK